MEDWMGGWRIEWEEGGLDRRKEDWTGGLGGRIEDWTGGLGGRIDRRREDLSGGFIERIY
jgi:hypothetical protein